MDGPNGAIIQNDQIKTTEYLPFREMFWDQFKAFLTSHNKRLNDFKLQHSNNTNNGHTKKDQIWSNKRQILEKLKKNEKMIEQVEKK